ncbi:MAG: hypothetical protein ACTSWJ_10935 [Candidatus Heimdallarchaeaceae archaeon]
MFTVHVHDNPEKQLPNDDIFFIVGKEGQFIKKKVGVLECLVPVSGISTLASVKELVTSYAKMHIKPITKKDFTRCFDFLRAVYIKHSAEGAILLYYNEKTEKHYIFVPKQEVSAAGVDYKRSYVREGFTMIGTIHSHANFSAFHSGTDHADETSFDGLHITVGNVMDDDFSLSASIMANGHRVMVDPTRYISGIKLTKDIDELEKTPATRTFIWSSDQKKLVEDTSKPKYVVTRRYDKRFSIVNPRQDRTFPKFWLEEQVEKKSWSYTGTGAWIRGNQQPLWDDKTWFDSWTSGKTWGPNYDDSYWNQKSIPPQHAAQVKVPPQNVGPYKRPGVVFPKHQQPDPSPDKVKKIMLWTLHELIKYFDVWERDIETAYYCKKCDTVCEWDDLEDPTDNGDYHCLLCSSQLDEVSLEPEVREKFDENTSESGFTIDEMLETIIGSAKAENARDTKQDTKSINCRKCMAIIADDDEICPYCNTPIFKGYSTEQEREDVVKKDSGEMLSEDAEEIEKQIMVDAAKRDDEVKLIPDPDKREIPLVEHVQATSRMSIKEMLKRTFGKDRQK